MSRRVLLWGGAILAGLILIGLLWPARHPAPVAAPVKPLAKLIVKFVHHLQRPPEETAPVGLPVAPAGETNAANIYRQAIALYEALSTTNKNILSDWQTNVDAAVEAELCEQLRPICDLLQQASAVTNCDWGLDQPLRFDSKLPHLGSARNLGRAAIWNAAHCRRNDAPAATDDVLATLHLGQQVSHGAGLIGYLVDIKMQEIAWSFVAANADRFTGADGQQLAAAFDDLSYDDAFQRAMEQEAVAVDLLATQLATMTPVDAQKTLFGLSEGDGGTPNQAEDLPDQATVIASLKQAANLDSDLAKILATGSGAEYEAWLQRYEALKASDPIANMFLGAIPNVVTKAQGYEVNRALVEAGLAVAANGAAGLTAHLDPSTGQPFTYQAVPGGFELQSTYQVKNQPLKMFFPQSATPKEKP